MTQRMVIFIHGLGGDRVKTWVNFPELLQADLDVQVQFRHVESFGYDTSLIAQSQPLSTIARSLVLFIEDKVQQLQLDEIAFICHSQGGLLARRYLCDVFARGRRPDAPHVSYRLLTFATPHWGAYSEKAGRLVPDGRAQLKGLAYDSAELLAVNRDWDQTEAGDRLKVCYVVAANDKLVTLSSAIGASFENDYLVVPGYDHSSIVEVTDANHHSFSIAKRFLLAPTSHQPALVNPDKTPPVLTVHAPVAPNVQGASRFVYSSRYIPLLARDGEKAQLWAFLHAPTQSNMAWMQVNGQGGVGKSRLALELCLAWQADWIAGFLNQDADQPDWARWQPQLPTLLVVDYATSDPVRLGRLLRGLCFRGTERRLRRPVRLLLLDRLERSEQLSEAIGPVTSPSTLSISACRQADLELKTIATPWLIIESFMNRANHALPDRTQVLEKLVKIDLAQRPLFAMLLADALTQNVPLATLTRESLMTHVLERERDRFWRPAAQAASVTLPKAERLLAFATMVNGLSLTQVLAPLEGWDTDTYAPVFRSMAGYSSQSDQIAPLEPDLLGECFVLQQFAQMSEQKVADLLALAWNQWPQQSFKFFDRFVQDFPTDRLIDTALDVP